MSATDFSGGKAVTTSSVSVRIARITRQARLARLAKGSWQNSSIRVPESGGAVPKINSER